MFWEVTAQDKAVRPVKSNWFIYQGIREQTNSEEKQESTNHAVNWTVKIWHFNHYVKCIYLHYNFILLSDLTDVSRQFNAGAFHIHHQILEQL